jgi:hypothetical protein
MFRISGINSDLNYKVNPQYQSYLKKYQEASKEYEYLERILKSKNANPTLVEKSIKAKKAMEIAENDCKNVPKIIKGGNLDLNDVEPITFKAKLTL